MRTFRRKSLSLAALAILLSSASPSSSQAPPPPIASSSPTDPVFDLDKDRVPLVSLDGPWRRHLGDNPAWADPAFDDSQWPIVRPSDPWPAQKFSGTAWYRAKVRIPAHQGPLALYLYYIDDSHQIFADGQLLLSAGGLPPRPRVYGLPPTTLSLPPHSPQDQPYTMTLAIRVWLWPGYADYHRGGLSPGSRIGRIDLVQDTLQTQTTRWAWDSVSRILLSILEGFAALAALALFALRRKEPEYLCFAIFLGFSVATRCLRTWFQFHALSNTTFGSVTGLLTLLGAIAEVAFYYLLLAAKRTWFFWVTVASGAALLVFLVLSYLEIVSEAIISVAALVLLLPSTLWILTLLFRRVRQGFPDARLLLLPVAFSKATLLLGILVWFLGVSSFRLGNPAWFDSPFHWPFTISLADIADTLFLTAMLAILIYRFTRTRLHEETYEREREAARTVQQVLVPQDNPTIPGFTIHSVYQPYGEVGGDFFQILPISTGPHTGSVLIAIGDVSGKGLPAAMTVSLLVGTLRTLAHYTQSPAEILTAMNQRMIGRANGGFTTCLVLRADPAADGFATLTLANAGHLAPYLDGVELPTDTGLPLGLNSDTAYPETTHTLASNQQLTLLTDGVLEARSKPTRTHPAELFGFDRTATLSTHSAQHIAQTAAAFGQDDDITALTLTLA